VALRHHSLRMSEVGDVTDFLYQFERQNRARLEVRLSTLVTGKEVDLGIVMLAHDTEKEIGEAPPLASVSLKCSAMNLKTLSAALLAALYALDFQLGVNEFDKVLKKKA